MKKKIFILTSFFKLLRTDAYAYNISMLRCVNIDKKQQ